MFRRISDEGDLADASSLENRQDFTTNIQAVRLTVNTREGVKIKKGSLQIFILNLSLTGMVRL